MQGTQIWFLVWEDPTCLGANKFMPTHRLSYFLGRFLWGGIWVLPCKSHINSYIILYFGYHSLTQVLSFKIFWDHVSIMKLQYPCQNAQMIINIHQIHAQGRSTWYFILSITKNVTFFKVTNEHQDETFDEIMLVLIQGV